MCGGCTHIRLYHILYTHCCTKTTTTTTTPFFLSHLPCVDVEQEGAPSLVGAPPCPWYHPLHPPHHVHTRVCGGLYVPHAPVSWVQWLQGGSWWVGAVLVRVVGWWWCLLLCCCVVGVHHACWQAMPVRMGAGDGVNWCVFVCQVCEQSSVCMRRMHVWDVDAPLETVLPPIAALHHPCHHQYPHLIPHPAFPPCHCPTPHATDAAPQTPSLPGVLEHSV